MDKKIIIVGAGVAGLVAAQHCEEAGYTPLVLEADSRAGGRVKTDPVQGFLLDQGFQVLLTEYQEAQRYLDFAKLDLHYFQAGAMVFSEGRSFRFGDPLRDPSLIGSALFSPIGSLMDKFKLWRLAQELQSIPREKVFDHQGQTTLAFLQERGFSKRIIDQFFRPFHNDKSTNFTNFYPPGTTRRVNYLEKTRSPPR